MGVPQIRDDAGNKSFTLVSQLMQEMRKVAGIEPRAPAWPSARGKPLVRHVRNQARTHAHPRAHTYAHTYARTQASTESLVRLPAAAVHLFPTPCSTLEARQHLLTTYLLTYLLTTYLLLTSWST